MMNGQRRDPRKRKKGKFGGHYNTLGNGPETM